MPPNAETPLCLRFVYWWNGEYEGNCELPLGHDGDHWDGLSWFNDDNEDTDAEHVDAAALRARADQLDPKEA